MSRCFLGHPEVGSSMEAVPPDAMEGVKAVGQRIDKSMGRHRLVEGRIEDRHLGHARENLPGRFDPQEVRRVVERGEGDEFSNRLQHLLIDQHRLPESLPPMDHPVADPEELRRVLDHGGFGGHAQDEAKPFLMVGHPSPAYGFFDRTRGPVGAVGVLALALPDPFQQPGGEDREVGGLEYFVLDRGASRIDDHDLHEPDPLSCAWMAVMATVFTMSVTVAPRLRSLTGRLSPCMTGPMATALADR